MANNYYPTTINTMIPLSAIKPDEMLVLDCFFQHEEDTGEDGSKSVYFFAEDGITNLIDRFDDNLVREAREYLASLPAVDASNEAEAMWREKVEEIIRAADAVDEVEDDNLWITAFQRIIARSGLPFVEYMGCYYCDKMRPGEFGGFAGVITRDDVQTNGTQQWLHEVTAAIKAEASPPLAA